MLVSYSQESTLTQAVSDTFSGEKPCHLCDKIAEVKSKEPVEENQKAPLPPSASKLFNDLFPPTIATLVDPFSTPFPQPAFLIEFAHARYRPLGVVGDESHDDFLAVNLDEHFHASEYFGILAAAFRPFEQDEVVAQDFSGGLRLELFPDGVGHVILGAGEGVARRGGSA
jgi:hypothetical protein